NSKELVWAHLLLGSILELKPDLDRAIVEYETATELDPQDPIAHKDLGRARFENMRRGGLKHNYDNEIKELQTAIGLNRSDALAYYILGQILCSDTNNHRDVAGAIKAYEQTVRRNPKNAAAHNELGKVLMEMDPKRNVDYAIKEFSAAFQG